MNKKANTHGLIEIFLAILVVGIIFFPMKIDSNIRFYVGVALVLLIITSKYLRSRSRSKKVQGEEDGEE